MKHLGKKCAEITQAAHTIAIRHSLPLSHRTSGDEVFGTKMCHFPFKWEVQNKKNRETSFGVPQIPQRLLTAAQSYHSCGLFTCLAINLMPTWPFSLQKWKQFCFVLNSYQPVLCPNLKYTMKDFCWLLISRGLCQYVSATSGTECKMKKKKRDCLAKEKGKLGGNIIDTYWLSFSLQRCEGWV